MPSITQNKSYKLILTEDEIRLCAYCIYAEYGYDRCKYIVDYIDCDELRKKLKGFIRDENIIDSK